MVRTALDVIAKGDRCRVPDVELSAVFMRGRKRASFMLNEGAAPPAPFVKPSREFLAFGLGSSPENACAFRIAPGQRDLGEPGDRVERPEPVLLLDLEPERGSSFVFGFVECTASLGEHHQLVELAGLPPVPACFTCLFRAAPRQLCRAFEIAIGKCKLAEQPESRDLHRCEPAAGKGERVLGQLPNPGPVFSSPRANGEHVLDEGDPTLVAELLVEPQALFGQSLGKFVVT